MRLLLAAVCGALLLTAGCGFFTSEPEGQEPGTNNGNPAVTTINPDVLTATMPIPEPEPEQTTTAAPPTTTQTPENTAEPAAEEQTAADNEIHDDILDYSCLALLSAAEISSALGHDIPDKQLRISEAANSGTAMTGRTKCYFGTGSASGPRPIVVSVSQYVDQTSAAFQLGRTADAELKAGAQQEDVIVSDMTATVLIREGGLLLLQNDTWTLAIALADELVPEEEIATALATLAAAAFETLTRSA